MFGSDGFSRESNATLWVGEHQCFRTFKPDEPRLFSDGSLYVEGARTNLMSLSNGLDMWTALGDARVSKAQEVLFRPFDAWSIETPPSSAGGIRRATDLGGGASTVYVSVFSAGFPWRLGFGSVSIDEPNQRDWMRHDYKTGEGSGPTPLSLVPDDSPDDHRFLGVQVERALFASQYIDSAGDGTGERAADNLTIAPLPQAMVADCWSANIWPAFSSDDVMGSTSTFTIFSFEGDGCDGSSCENVSVQLRATSVGGQFCFGSGCGAPFVTWDRGDKFTVTINRLSQMVVGNDAQVDRASSVPVGQERLLVGFDGTTASNPYFGRVGLPRSVACP